MATAGSTERLSDALGLVAAIARAKGWEVEEPSTSEITLQVTWRGVIFSLSVIEQSFGLICGCQFELPSSPASPYEVWRVALFANRSLCWGHFDPYPEHGSIVHRSSLVLAGEEPTPEQCENLIANATDSCQRYFPSFCAATAGVMAESAMGLVSFEAESEA